MSVHISDVDVKAITVGDSIVQSNATFTVIAVKRYAKTGATLDPGAAIIYATWDGSAESDIYASRCSFLGGVGSLRSEYPAHMVDYALRNAAEAVT